MGQKVSPILLRTGFIKNWGSRWFASRKDYPVFIKEDYEIRRFIRKKFKQAAIANIVVERLAERVRIRVFAARPGIIIGRRGADIESLREDLNNMLKREISIDIEEVKDPSLSAALVGQNVAAQIEKRIAYRRAIKRAIDQSMNAGAKGVKVICAGRLGGAEMSRTETYKQGKIPLATLRADIDYALTEALTTYGLIGIKVWIYKGDILTKHGEKKVTEDEKVAKETKDEGAKAKAAAPQQQKTEA